mgnify:CR=1 FL=1
MEIIKNKTIFNGIAGKRKGEPMGVVIENVTTEKKGAEIHTELFERKMFGDSWKGFAHCYGDKDAIVFVEELGNCAWHTGDNVGNESYLGYAVLDNCDSDEEFLEGEDVVLMQVAEDMHRFNMTPSDSTVMFLTEFDSSKTLPQRSTRLHGAKKKGVKSHFIKRIQYYMSMGTTVDDIAKKSKEQSEKKVNFNPSAKIAPAKANFKVGDKATFRDECTEYADGTVVGKGIRRANNDEASKNVYTIKQVKKMVKKDSKFAYLLKEIMTWVLEEDIEKEDN